MSLLGEDKKASGPSKPPAFTRSSLLKPGRSEVPSGSQSCHHGTSADLFPASVEGSSLSRALRLCVQVSMKELKVGGGKRANLIQRI